MVPFAPLLQKWTKIEEFLKTFSWKSVQSAQDVLLHYNEALH